MKLFRSLIFVCTGGLIILLCLANQEMVTIRVLPDGFSLFNKGQFIAEFPLFLIILFFSFLGICFGACGEWVRANRNRRRARLERKEYKNLEKELLVARKKSKNGSEDLLAMLED
tara:strand:- start:214 stop:558 length:345 start_codon:yes stop_codon:yes gene_type:complete